MSEALMEEDSHAVWLMEVSPDASVRALQPKIKVTTALRAARIALGTSTSAEMSLSACSDLYDEFMKEGPVIIGRSDSEELAEQAAEAVYNESGGIARAVINPSDQEVDDAMRESMNRPAQEIQEPVGDFEPHMLSTKPPGEEEWVPSVAGAKTAVVLLSATNGNPMHTIAMCRQLGLATEMPELYADVEHLVAVSCFGPMLAAANQQGTPDDDDISGSDGE